MSTSLTTQSLTEEQRELIKNTIAKNATDDELKLFLYRAKEMGLDPLKPGQIHFVKYGHTGSATIVVGIEGFRAKAAQTGKHAGTKRGVIRDEKGKCIGGWAEVYRSDWAHPAREEVSFAEYSTGRNNWQKMPETMIKKVAEVAALRIAFPEQLGGVYADEEMEQAAPAAAEKPPAEKKEEVGVAFYQRPVIGTIRAASKADIKRLFDRGVSLGFNQQAVMNLLEIHYPEAVGWDKVTPVMVDRLILRLQELHAKNGTRTDIEEAAAEYSEGEVDAVRKFGRDLSPSEVESFGEDLNPPHMNGNEK